MSIIRVRIMKEDQRVEPFDCPAGKAKANCVNCNYLVGHVREGRAEEPTVRCCWEECMIRVKEWPMETNLNIRYGVRLPGYISIPKVTREIEVNDD